MKGAVVESDESFPSLMTDAERKRERAIRDKNYGMDIEDALVNYTPAQAATLLLEFLADDTHGALVERMADERVRFCWARLLAHLTRVRDERADLPEYQAQMEAIARRGRK